MMHTAAGTTSRMVAVFVAAVAVVLGLVACGASPSAGDNGTTAAVPGSDAIIIKDFAFGPQELIVTPGATITVTNQDKSTHTVTAADKSFDSGNIAAGQTGKVTAPTKPGSYPFACIPHPFMTGTLVVR